MQTKQPYAELDLEMDAAGLSWVRLTCQEQSGWSALCLGKSFDCVLIAT